MNTTTKTSFLQTHLATPKSLWWSRGLETKCIVRSALKKMFLGRREQEKDMSGIAPTVQVKIIHARVVCKGYDNLQAHFEEVHAVSAK